MDLVGKQVGPYRLVDLIGRGGTAEVYKAFHPVLDRQVAVKVLLRETSQDPDWVRRFRREAQLLGQLDHPHILPIFDAGEDQGRPYLVMKYIDNGATLRSKLDGTPWPLPRVIHVLDQVTEALHSAHEAGIVHRDIKPSNILVTPDDRCMVFDFGIAKPYKIVDSSTDEGFVVGTPEFMSPEQCRGDKIDNRSDIYSLGVMTYQLLTGHVPFTAESAVGVLMKHLTAPLPIPAERAPLSPEVNRVLARALSRAPEDRYASVRKFNKELHEAVGYEPTVTIVSGTVKQPAWKLWAYRLRYLPRRALGLAAAASLALALGGVLLGYQLFSPTDDLSVSAETASTDAESSGEPVTAGDHPRTEQPEALESRQPPIQTAPRLEPGFLSVESNRPAAVILDGQIIGNTATWRRAPANEAPATANRPMNEHLAPTIRRWEGYLTDELCRDLGGQQGALHLKSALRCIREGRRPMLYSLDGNLYTIEGLERIRLVEDAPLSFLGRLDAGSNTIHVTSNR